MSDAEVSALIEKLRAGDLGSIEGMRAPRAIAPSRLVGVPFRQAFDLGEEGWRAEPSDHEVFGRDDVRAAQEQLLEAVFGAVSTPLEADVDGGDGSSGSSLYEDPSVVEASEALEATLREALRDLRGREGSRE